MNDYLYQKVKSMCYKPNLVAEVGVYLPHTSNILGFINDNIETILVEPDPKCIEKKQGLACASPYGENNMVF